jgi:hypothetical protein
MLAAMAAMMVALPSAAFPCIGEHRSGASSAGSESRATTQSECGCCCAQESDATPPPVEEPSSRNCCGNGPCDCPPSCPSPCGAGKLPCPPVESSTFESLPVLTFAVREHGSTLPPDVSPEGVFHPPR